MNLVAERRPLSLWRCGTSCGFKCRVPPGSVKGRQAGTLSDRRFSAEVPTIPPARSALSSDVRGSVPLSGLADCHRPGATWRTGLCSVPSAGQLWLCSVPGQLFPLVKSSGAAWVLSPGHRKSSVLQPLVWVRLALVAAVEPAPALHSPPALPPSPPAPVAGLLGSSRPAW